MTGTSSTSLFGIVVVVAFQNAFRLEMYWNIFFLKKKHFDISALKWSKNTKNNQFEAIKNSKFCKNTFQPQNKRGLHLLLHKLAFCFLQYEFVWFSFFINRYLFHTEEYGQGKQTYNSGVCVKGSTSNEFKVD
jgi:hypothetical protein